MATFDEKYLASYKDAFMEVEGIDELENVLPSNKFPGYDELLVYLDAFVVNEIKAVNDSLEESVSSSDKEHLKKELDSLIIKRRFLETKLTSEKETKENPTHLIFATSSLGNIFFERDMKSVPDEYVQSFGSLLEDLSKGPSNFSRFNESKDKKFDTNTKGVSIFERKGFKTRIYYLRLNDNIKVIIMATLKNQDNPKLLNESLEARYKNCASIVEDIKVSLNDPEKREQLLKEHDLIRDRLVSTYKGSVKDAKREI